MELIDGARVTLADIQSGGHTFNGKPVKFECIDQQNQVWQGATELTDEDKAAGNSKKVFTFSLGASEGTITMAVQPIAQQEQQDAAKKVMQSRRQQAENAKNEVAVPFVETGGQPLEGSAPGIGGFGNKQTSTGEAGTRSNTDTANANKKQDSGNKNLKVELGKE